MTTVSIADRTFERRRASRITWIDLVCLLAPVLMSVQINLIGRLFGTEVILLLLVPAVLLIGGGLDRLGRLPMRVLLVASLWLWGQMVTDLVRGSEFVDYSRGWLRIVFLAINFVVIYLLVDGDRRRIALFTIGLSGGLLFSTVVSPSTFFPSDPWKFGYAVLFMFVVALFASQRRIRDRRFLAGALFVGIAALNLGMGDRGHAGMAFLAGVYLLARDLRRRRAGGTPVTPVRVALLAAAMLVSGYGFLKIYEHAAASGMLGVAEQQKHRLERQGAGGILFGGRPEIVVSLRAIAKEPVIGHGSYAPDASYLADLNAELRARGYSQAYFSSSGMIPTHSHLFGAWVESGIFGAVFWIAVLAFAFRALVVVFARPEPLAPLVALLTTMMLWDIMFSPYGAERRVIVAWALVVFTTVLEHARRDRGSAPA